MEFLFSLYSDEKMWATMSEADAEREMGAYVAYTQALRDAGVWVEGNRLAPVATSTRVRVDGDGKTSVLDGPYAETKEQLGGYFIIEVPDLDTAIAWAARCPGASHGTVEVRPTYGVPQAV